MRQANYPIQPIILNRWSPRAMSGETITEDELLWLFEAARWAPSSGNYQPWKFIYAKQKSPQWQSLLDTLQEKNKVWAVNSSALILVVSNKIRNGKPAHSNTFDTGAAWANIAIEGTSRGLVVHGMAGFDYQKAKEVCKVPDDYKIEILIAVGKKGDVNSLPEWLQKTEKPSDRKPLSEIIMEGSFPE